METAGTPRRHSLRKLIGYAFLTSVFLGILPVIPRMVGYGFLPSYEWMSTAGVVGLASGLVFAATFTWFGWKSKDKIPGSPLKRGVGIVVMPFFGFFMGQNLILIAPPMIAALVAGHQVETSFTVADAHYSGSSSCRSPVELRDLPYFFNKVCRVSSQFRKSVSQGTEVKVIGHGTELGLFVQDIRPASQIGATEMR